MKIQHSIILCLAFAVLLALPHVSEAQKCNSYNAPCGFNRFTARAKYLTSYASLVRKLSRFSSQSDGSLRAGPLFKSADAPDGLLDIDMPLDKGFGPSVNVSVCGVRNATIRESVVCTVSRSGAFAERGNLVASRVGLSTQGRVLYGVRVGNASSGVRVMISSQIHGNEPAGTEAVLRFLRRVSSGQFAHLTSNLDMLFLVRVNIDAGEPTGDADPPPTGPFVPKPAGFGFFRQNVDPSAGGAFAAPTEPDFFGAVGRGYDLNRYNHFGLDQPVRPVEAQAVVAAALAFRPAFMFDLHGDMQKTACQLDPTSITPPQKAIIFPTLTCARPAPRKPSFKRGRRHVVVSSISAYDHNAFSRPNFDEFSKSLEYSRMTRTSRNVAAHILARGQQQIPGAFTRFSQIQFAGASGFSSGLVHLASARLGALGTLIEVANFRRETRLIVVSFTFSNGTGIPSLGYDTEDVDPCFLADNICIHQENLKNALTAAVKFANAFPAGDGAFCSFAVNSGLYVKATEKYFGPLAVNGSFIVPQAGLFGVPIAYNGACPGDIGA